MIIDFREMEAGTALQADICIVGAGAAGITLAMELAGTGADILLVESGGREFDAAIQQLYAGPNIGHHYFDNDLSRLRYFGGTTNHWGGRCIAMDALDFRKRDWVPHSGWPITRAELEPFYQRAAAFCAMGRAETDPAHWVERGVRLDAFDPAKLETVTWQVSPLIPFTSAYAEPLEAARTVRVLLHANVTNIQAADNAASVDRLDIATLDGKAGTVRARAYVLATGALEVPRLMLASNTVEASGLGNRHDRVGRFFMEHPHAFTTVLLAADEADVLARYGYHEFNGHEMQIGLALGHALQEREGVLNASASLDFRINPESGILALRDIYRAVREGQLPVALGDKLYAVVADIDGVVGQAYRRVRGEKLGGPTVPGFILRTEQAPNPDSRVTLIQERDALGMPRLALDWRLNAQDKRTLEVMSGALAEEVGRLGLGRVRVDDWVAEGAEEWGPDMEGGFHHMGTTRMHADPRQGVVDADSRVHGYANLYVAGPSVFTTGGYANPTLTAVALTMRLADRLAADFA